MKNKIGKRKIQAGALITSVVVAIFVIGTVPSIVADNYVPDPPQDPVTVYDGQVTIYLNSSDAYSGVAYINYSVYDRIQLTPGSEIIWEQVSGSQAIIDVIEPGNWTVAFFAVDTLGNQETVQFVHFDIYEDDLPPETTCELGGVVYSG